MRDSLGTVGTLMLVLFFIALVSGYMAYNVNYTKAFKMMNKIIDLYNEYDGVCPVNSECGMKITNYARDIGYSPSNSNLRTCDSPDGLYCVSTLNYGENRHFYKITTFIDINIPTVDKFLGLRILSISGETRTFKN